MVLAAKAPFVALLLAALTGCGAPTGSARALSPPSPPSSESLQPTLSPSLSPQHSPSRTAATPGKASSTSTGWTVTVYYTAVAKFHAGKSVKVTGCPTIDCKRGNSDLGSYPSDFVAAVKDEGAGKISDGKYLNWSYDTGYWLDTAARVSDGGVLRPFETAAADPAVLRAGTAFRITACGRDESGDPIDAAVCAKLRSAQWTVGDEFTPGLGGSRHLDAYIGEETGPDFTASPWYTTLTGATIAIS